VNIVDWHQHPVDVQVPAQGAAIRLSGIRRIWIVQVRTSDGIIGWGECTQALDLAAIKATLPWHMKSVPDAFGYACSASGHATGRFAVESALLDAWTTKQGVPLRQCIDVNEECGLSLAAITKGPARPLCSGKGPAFTPPHVSRAGTESDSAINPSLLAVVVDNAAQAKELVQYGCFKIKLTADAQQDLERCTAIRQTLGNTVVLRGDANQAWSLEQTPARLRQLAHLDFQFIEEPCRDAHRLTVLQLPIPIALDESIPTIPSSSWPALKPAWLGGISPCIAMATMAAQASKQAVVTHALDGPIGHAAGFATGIAVHDMMRHVDDGGDPKTFLGRKSIGFGNNPTLMPNNGRWAGVQSLDGHGLGFTNPPAIDKWFQPNGNTTT
jgi:L-alanine-DL-glutamate epimerase-like enolase superfamily enzyme